MNNDITCNMQNYANIKAKNPVVQSSKKDAILNVDSSASNKMQDSMSFLGSLGCAQVNMNNSLRRSVDEYLANPDFVESHVALCDLLVQEGYSLEKALSTTDMAFDTLRLPETYKS